MEFIRDKIRELEGLTRRYTEDFSALSAAEMDLKPDAKSWSINECLEHVILTNASYHATLDEVAGQRYRGNAWTRVPLLPALWGRMILKAVSPAHEGKSKTFPIWAPTSSAHGRNLTGDLAAANAELAAKLRRLGERDLDRIISSAAGAFVTYPLRTGITILVEHGKRHLNQARRVKDGLARNGKT